MYTSEMLIGTLEGNYYVLAQQTRDVTHEDSLLQLPFRGNCLNWVIGHIVQHRDLMLAVLDADPVLNAEEASIYESGSAPIVESSQALPFERLLADLALSHERLIAILQTISEEELTAPYGDGRRNIGQRLAGLGWHETYHCGQTEILRQLAGKDDKVI